MNGMRMEVMKSYSQGDRFLKMIRRTDPMILNDMMHEIMYWTSVYRGKIKEIYINYKNTLNSYDTSESFYEDYLGGDIGQLAKESPNEYRNTCAARLSDALNQSGIEIPYKKGVTYKDKNGNNVFIRAIDLKNYFVECLGRPRIAKSSWKILNAFVYQTGFGGGISGHVDVFSQGHSANKAYLYHKTKGIQTYYW